MSRLIGLVGEDGTGEARIRRSGAGDRDRGLVHHRSTQEWKHWSVVLAGLLYTTICERVPCLGGRAGALGRGLEGAVCSMCSPFSSLAVT